MIKNLKLTKAVIVIVLGAIALIIARVMDTYKIEGARVVLGISGGLLIIGALIFLYPILFAKKADKDGKQVELQPAAQEPTLKEEEASA